MSNHYMQRLLFIINDPAFFISHRLPIAEAARLAGFDVHIATKPGLASEDIRQRGFKYHSLPLSRSSQNPLAELKALFSIWILLWQLKPDILHLVTIKPVLYGGIAARFAPVKSVVAAVSGLGFVFLASGIKATFMRWIIGWLYRFALGKVKLQVVFQNEDDREVLRKLSNLPLHNSVLIRGSGVNLAEVSVQPELASPPVIVTMAARLLWDKGVAEFVEAARLLQAQDVEAQFQLVGDLDPSNPASVTSSDLDRWRRGREVALLGYQKDISSVFARSHIIVLPSYREGLPKVLIEAAACARAVVTTDVAGCRDAIEANITGLLVPVRDPVALAEAIGKLIDNPELRRTMGQAGRKLAEREFAIEKVVAQHLDVYEQLKEAM